MDESVCAVCECTSHFVGSHCERKHEHVRTVLLSGARVGTNVLLQRSAATSTQAVEWTLTGRKTCAPIRTTQKSPSSVRFCVAHAVIAGAH